MSRAHLTLAISDYDHVRDLTSGRIRPEGIDLTSLHFEVEEIFYRFTKFREWDVSELSFGKYVALTAADDPGIAAIPVFPSRAFRQSALYVRADSPLTDPAALAGKRVGIPEWAQTAGIYARGWLAETVGLDLAAIDWVQAGVNQPGRVEKVALDLPAGVRITPMPDATLTGLLLDGGIDAAITAHPPAPFEAGSGEIRHMLADPRAAELDYFRATGIFPIMHVVALRRAVLDTYPWAAMNLLTAFEAAKRRALARSRELTASRYPIPWSPYDALAAAALFGDDPFPYGIAANRVTLEAFLRFAYEQGVARRLLAPEELFPPTVQSAFKV